MLSAGNSKHLLGFILKVTGVLALKRSLQNWIRTEIVDDDPMDVETYFPEASTDETQQSQDFLKQK